MPLTPQQFTRLPVTEKMLINWAGERVFKEGQSLFRSGAVQTADYEHPLVSGVLSYGNRELRCEFRLAEDLSVENRCPCRDNQDRGLICPHLIAVSYALIIRQSDPERMRQAAEEQRRARRLAEFSDDDYLTRVDAGTSGARGAALRLTLSSDWRAGVGRDTLNLRCELVADHTTVGLGEADRRTAWSLDASDDSLLYVLEDICEGPARTDIEMSVRDFLSVLKLRAGKTLELEGGGEPAHVNDIVMSPLLTMEMDTRTGELILAVHTELPFMDPDHFPVYLIAGRQGWVFDAGHFWKMDRVLPGPLQSVYAKPMVVERPSVPRFMNTELPLIQAHIQVQTDVYPDLFSIAPARPVFLLHVKGSPASMAAELIAEYGDGAYRLVAGKADAAGGFALPDPEDLMRYLVRDPDREQEALERLAETGFQGSQGDDLTSVVGTREVMNFLGRDLPRLRRLGWRVTLEGRVEQFMEEADFVTPVVQIHKGGEGSGWFEVDFDYEDVQGGSVSSAEIQRALNKGESYVRRGERTWLLDGDAIERAADIFEDCRTSEGSQAGRFRLADVYASYVKDSLDALDGIDVEAEPAWMQAARTQGRTSSPVPEPLPADLEGILRPYQKEGVYWMRFLEAHRFGGILADEMGLGKTLQTLTWLSLDRIHDSARAKPALIVCPTSLVENWQDEAEKFTPHLKVQPMSGPDRHALWEALPRHDLVITSYALLRRDAEAYKALDLAAIILDEAQHIKNRSTQNALAAKSIAAEHRLVLTGTPMENGVADLWSIMDFLMPRYLGGYKEFRERYEQPIESGGTDVEYVQKKLRRKIHPFLMRRLKKDVAKDLPPKIEKLATCSLSPDQTVVYRELAGQARRTLNDLVDQKGFNQSRMEVLKILMQLRQACCHLDLLKMEDVAFQQPSAKMALFFEMLDEAVDGGHRILVFSQFTSMLAILRRELEERRLEYRYLDGSTKNRLSIVRDFNTNRNIPVFLISLKAGGTGLNLTGADMVIHFDPWWNPAVEDQATDRAYRIGQNKTVYSVKMITKGTVEEKVLEMQKKKKALYDATLSSDEEAAGRLTWEDVQDLLAF